MNPTAMKHLVEIVRLRAQTQGNRVAYTFLSAQDEEAQTMTFAQLDVRARKVAALLQQRTQPHDRVLLLYPSGFDYIVAFLGCLYAGVIAVPAYPPDPTRWNRTLPRLDGIVKDCQAKVALTTTFICEMMPSFAEAPPSLTSLPWLATDGLEEGMEEHWTPIELNDHQIAFLQYTSGSTSAPKGVMVTHRNLLENSRMSHEAALTTPECVGVSWLPMYHDMGLIGKVLQPMYMGCHVVLMSPLDFLQKPVRWLQAITRFGGVFSAAPNFAYELCVRHVTEHEKAALNLSTWRIALNGAEPIRPQTLERFAETFHACGFRQEAFFPSYGLAEATLFVTGGPPLRPIVKHTQSIGCGTVASESEVRIVHPEHKVALPEGEVGEIWVSGHHVAAGYWNNPSQTEATFRARLPEEVSTRDFLRTGDLGCMRDGELFVMARMKDVIIVRGENFYPQDIELTVERAHRSVRPGCVAAFSSQRLGEESLGIAFEVDRAGEAEGMAEQVAEAVRTSVLERHGLSASVLVALRRGTLFKTSSGKIQRHATQQGVLEGTLETLYRWESAPPAAPSVAVAASTNALTAILTEWVSQSTGLSVSSVDPDRPFVHLGLESKDAVRLSGVLEERLGRKFDPTIAYQYPTIHKLSQYLANITAGGEDTPPAPVAAHSSPQTKIAIVGVGCRVPQASNPEALWRILEDQVDATSELPSRRLEDAAFEANIPRRGGFLEDVESFDPHAFDISDVEARSLDPQQRLLLEVTWEALENAGIAPKSLSGSPTGVFVGISTNDYAQRLRAKGALHPDPFSGTGNAFSTAAGRISYTLGLQGPSMALDTACSSSLVAVHLACQSLRSGETALAIAGGVNLILALESTLYLSTLQALSPDGRCKTFDASANGFARGEGCALVVLKRWEDALASGDNILGVIRGSAVNQDGASNGLTAPNGSAQEAVIRAALAQAGVAPQEVSYVEAHGTGTRLGDPIELQALQRALGAGRPKNKPLYVGSIKTNVGHLEAAAGVAGLIKVVLSMQHGKLPAHLHFTQPTPHVPWNALSLRVPTALTEWSGPGRIAGVSSFGLSGTNAHVIVESAPWVESPRPVRRACSLLPLAAQSAEALRLLAQAYRDVLVSGGPLSQINIEDICDATQATRTHGPYRMAFTGGSREELAQAMQPACLETHALSKVRSVVARSTAFLFSGNGSQSAAMGRQLFESHRVFREAMEACDAAFSSHLKTSLLSALYPARTEDAALTRTEMIQPAIFAVGYALGQTWRWWGIEPSVLLGHSLGEYAAACLAGVFSLEDAARLVSARARLMQTLCPEGAMLSVHATEADVQPWVENAKGALVIATHNGGGGVVLSGTPEAIDSVARALEEQGRTARRLEVNRAFHSPLMEPMLQAFEDVARTVVFAAPRIPIISSVTGKLADAETLSHARYWVRQIRQPVQLGEAVSALESLHPDAVVEIGAQNIMIGLHRRNAPASAAVRVASLARAGNDVATMSSSLGVLYTHGFVVNWERFAQRKAPKLADLPTTPFARKRYWVDAEVARAAPFAAPVETPLAESSRTLLALQKLLAELLHGNHTDVALPSPDVPLIDLGADSLVLIEGVQRISRQFGVRVELQDVMTRMPTLRALARHISEGSSGEAKAERVANIPAPESGGWTEKQKAHISELTSKHQARTQGSLEKQKASHRHLADARATVGFRQDFPVAVKEQWRVTKGTCYPIVGARSKGARIWDVDGNEYIDFAMGFGVHLFGHGYEPIVRAIEEQLRDGIAIGPQSDKAGEAARILCRLTGVERLTFCSSGTDAVMVALRLARGVVRRPKIALFAGSYHGSFDGVLGAIPMTLGSSPGLVSDTLVLEYGHPKSLELIAEHADELSAVLVEPIQGRRPEHQPRAFLHQLRALTEEKGIALIFDEVLVGFRVHQGGAQAYFGVQADIVTYGKIAGGGLPIGVVAGKAKFLDAIDGGCWSLDDLSTPHTQSVWFAGTFNKNPLQMSATLAALRELERLGPSLQEGLNAKTAGLVRNLNEDFERLNAPIEAVCAGSLFRFKLHRTLEPFYFHLLARGIYVWEGRSMFVSTAHSDEDLDTFRAAVNASIEALREGGLIAPRKASSESVVPAVGAVSPVSKGPAVTFLRARKTQTLKLYCFPYAGGSSSVYRRWAAALPESVGLGMVHLPGRGPRAQEALMRDFPSLVSTLAADLLPSLDAPFAFFGHSMGALLAFEVARLLKQQKGPQPQALFVSGEPAPQVERTMPNPPVHEWEDQRLVGELVRYGVTPELLNTPALMQPLLPTLRADLAVCASYRYVPTEPLACGISVFAGARDPLGQRTDMVGWAEQTSEGFSLCTFPGDHFFIRTEEAAVLKAIREVLERHLESAEDSPGEWVSPNRLRTSRAAKSAFYEEQETT